MKALRALALSLLVCSAALAQNAALMPVPHLQFFDQNGYPLSGGLVYTCIAGSSCPGTPQASYTDATAGTPNANPVVLDGSGSAAIWLGSNAYKIVVESSAGVVLSTTDNVKVTPAGSASFGGLTVTGNGSIAGTLTVSGAATFASTVTAQSANGVLNAASFTGSDLGAKITAALAACPSTGCTIEVPVGSSGNVSAPIAVAKPNVKIVCDGNMTVKFTQNFSGSTAAAGSLFYVVNVNGFELSGCYLDANMNNSTVTSNTDNGLVYLVNSNFAHIYRNYFHDGTASPHSGTQNGVRFVGGTPNSGNGNNPACSPASITCQQGYVTASYNEVDHNVFDTVPWMATSAGENGGYNDIHDNAFYTVGEAFDFNGNNVDSPGNKFHHNTVVGLGTECFLESVTGSQVDNNFFSMAGNTSALWVHTAVTTVAARNKISANIFYGPGSTNIQPAIFVFANSQDTQILGNQIYNLGGDGIDVSGQGGTSQRSYLRDNEIYSVGLSGSGFCAVRLANGGSSNAVVDSWITANTLSAPTGGYGLCSDSTAPVHAVAASNSGSINFPSGCSNCTIATNEESPGTANTQAPSNFAGTLQGLHFTSNSATPTIAVGTAGVGTGAAASIQGNDADGDIVLTTGTGTSAAAGALFTVTFAKPYASKLFCTVSQAGQFNASGFTYVSEPSLATFSVSSNASYPLTASQSYVWAYHCGGY